MNIETNTLDKIDISKVDNFLQNKDNKRAAAVEKKTKRRVRPMACEMHDFLGNKLTIGDRVVFVASRDKGLEHGIVTRFEPRMVILDLDGVYQRRAYKKVMRMNVSVSEIQTNIGVNQDA